MADMTSLKQTSYCLTLTYESTLAERVLPRTHFDGCEHVFFVVNSDCVGL